LQNSPFAAGDKVEVIINEQNATQVASNEYSLKSTVTRYEDPFEPVISPNDWDANN